MATNANLRRARLNVESLEDRRVCANWLPGSVPQGGAVQMANAVDNDDSEVVFCAVQAGGTDKPSPVFFKNCCTGSHYKQVVITMRKAGGDPSSAGKEFLRFKFGTVFTTKIDWSGPGDEGPEESITFVYDKVGVRYIPMGTGDDDPLICQALFQRLAPRAPQYGAQINYAGDRLDVYFDPSYTVTQGTYTQPTLNELPTING
jgi:hypothetical protein